MVVAILLQLRNQIRHPMTKLTALEWFVEQIRLTPDEDFNAITISKLKMEAKKMEIEQIEQAFVDGVDSGSLSDANDYFAKTFK
jgi:hypothetical protein